MSLITIENAIVNEIRRNGEVIGYSITPIDGYVLHDKQRDWYNDYDEDGNGIGEVYLGYTALGATCPANYDFAVNPREFYAVPENTVPADQIFGGVNNDHEVM